MKKEVRVLKEVRDGVVKEEIKKMKRIVNRNKLLKMNVEKMLDRGDMEIVKRGEMIGDLIEIVGKDEEKREEVKEGKMMVDEENLKKIIEIIRKIREKIVKKREKLKGGKLRIEDIEEKKRMSGVDVD